MTAKTRITRLGFSFLFTVSSLILLIFFFSSTHHMDTSSSSSTDPKMILVLINSGSISRRCASFIDQYASEKGIEVEVGPFACGELALRFMGLWCTDDECPRYAINKPKIHAILTDDFYYCFEGVVKAKDLEKSYENIIYSSLNVAESMYVLGFNQIIEEDTPEFHGVRSELYSKIKKILF